MAAACFIAFAIVGVMTDGRQWPHVVHRPHDRLAALEDFLKTTQREQALIHPMQMDDVGLLKLWRVGDVDSRVGYRHLEKILATKAVVQLDDKAFPVETPLFLQLAPSTGHYGDVVGLLVTHHHLGLHTVVVQCVAQTRGRHGSTACALTCVHYQYSHSDAKGTKKTWIKSLKNCFFSLFSCTTLDLNQ